jgi:hypothetical protein
MSERLKRGGAAAADEEQALRALLSHSDGARGFYVTTLTAPELQNVTLPRSHPEHYNTREKESEEVLRSTCLGAHAGSARCT